MADRRRTAILLAGLILGGACHGSPAAAPSPTTASPSPSSSPTLSASPRVRLVQIATVPQALGMAVRPGDPSLYVVAKTGRVERLPGPGGGRPETVLDISDRVSRGSEQGLLGLAFSPDGRFAYLNSTDRKGDTNIVEYAWSERGPDLSSERRVLFVDQPFPNHNGGQLAFGPDGDLYIGLGDGGSNGRFGDPQGDPYRNGQNLKVFLGKMLRIQPRAADGSVPKGGYAIPADNPFVDRPGARPEIWAYGLRNPWRFSFDRGTGDLWIADVGAGAMEEVDRQAAGSAGGQNYGWNAVEGTAIYRPPPANAVAPVFTYTHISGGCAIVGGYVYRGSAIPALEGWYVYGDFCLGAVDGLQLLPSTHRVEVLAGTGVPNLSSFGQDANGELYALSLDGEVFALRP
jgi:glucose/arabinose dehydrogenase